jgi:hypothetical protein
VGGDDASPASSWYVLGVRYRPVFTSFRGTQITVFPYIPFNICWPYVLYIAGKKQLSYYMPVSSNRETERFVPTCLVCRLLTSAQSGA